MNIFYIWILLQAYCSSFKFKQPSFYSNYRVSKVNVRSAEALVKKSHFSLELNKSGIIIASSAIVCLGSLTSTSLQLPNLLEYMSYLKYFFAGGACASFSHAVAVPIDVIKIRMQTYPNIYTGIIQSANLMIEKEGLPILFKGLGPTILGYSIHGSLKYGVYESMKPVAERLLSYSGLYGSSSMELKLMTFMMSGVLAEVIASCAILPLEAARIRMVNDPSFATGTVDALTKVLLLRGNSSIYQSLPAIMAKHIPFTVMQLTSFELLTASIYAFLGSSGLPPAQTSAIRVVLTAGAALSAGMFASIVSQPGDTLLSRINSEVVVEGSGPVNNPFKKLLQSIRTIGLIGLFRGARARLLHICIIYVVQLTIYDYIKQLLGILPTGHP